ncbi:hypothetical protein AMATHDRAFT_47162 [Amanita thiersii Skay4041]|uniref:Uncharacterized protein n=1 Tax=Amanita thiersii Skay4041 TaxID=703135 RepID=A0A2A9NPL7_9AGAR|nr:hypothetical protein AMATHDRAFT_47162 [Amanita thiersii Skay4041]
MHKTSAVIAIGALLLAVCSSAAISQKEGDVMPFAGRRSLRPISSDKVLISAWHKRGLEQLSARHPTPEGNKYVPRDASRDPGWIIARGEETQSGEQLSESSTDEAEEAEGRSTQQQKGKLKRKGAKRVAPFLLRKVFQVESMERNSLRRKTGGPPQSHLGAPLSRQPAVRAIHPRPQSSSLDRPNLRQATVSDAAFLESQES